jgi:molecular chaperone DnaK (HSP70)
MSPRYAIGIDLGTTNCALAYVDLRTDHAGAEVLPITQRASFDSVRESLLLPSFFYYATEAEAARGPLNPFNSDTGEELIGYVIGSLAQDQMHALPGRVIHSAKSWLAHGGVDREAPMLPFGSEEISPELRLSPVEASAAYLEYLKLAWDDAFARQEPDNAFVKQRIVVTVPASFDEGAQVLTRKAAALAGYPGEIRLLEEPQAAFYAWVASAARSGASAPGAQLLDRLPALAHRAQTVLVLDIGGGTSDFSLFRIAPLASANARPMIERIATSDHLLLGGDNIDLALAHFMERLLKPGTEERLSRQQWGQLVPQARALKERIFEAGAAASEVFPISVGGDAGNLFRSALGAQVSRDAVEQLVIEGFFPLTAVAEMPRGRAIGLREVGLPYAADTAISRHLAAFLSGSPVDAVLFAGGTLRPRLFQERLLDLIEGWQGRRPAQLSLQNMSLAIAEGAAHFAGLPDRHGERIRGGYPRSVYLELQRQEAEKTTRLVCVLPQGFEEGSTLKLASPAFHLLVNRPVRFTAYTSNRRADDTAGTIVRLDEDAFHALPPLHTTLVLDDSAFNPRAAGEQRVRVQLEATLTELGVLRLALADETGRHWALDFNLRKPAVPAQQPDEPGETVTPQVPPQTMQAARSRIELFYGKKQLLDPRDNAKSLTKDLERLLRQERERWNIALLRSLWPSLYPGITRRGRSLAHENTWLYLAGMLLRPGYGDELDPWRMTELWPCFDLGLVHRKEKSAQSNWWMMWRRTAGGLDSGQQQRLFDVALPQFRRSPAEFVEGTRLLGSLERIVLPCKLEFVRLLFDLVLKGKATNQPHVFWALRRLLTRVPLYTGAESVMPAGLVEDYFARVESLDWKKLGLEPLTAVFSFACRRTNTRALDIHDDLRARVVGKLKRSGANDAQVRVVQEYCEVEAWDRNDLFGEQLPAGLRLID